MYFEAPSIAAASYSFPWNLFQAGQEDDHGRAERPDEQQDKRVEIIAGMRNPTDRAGELDTDEGQKLVQDALDAEEPAPQQRNSHTPAHKGGHIEDPRNNGRPGQFTVQHECQRQGHEQLQGARRS